MLAKLILEDIKLTLQDLVTGLMNKKNFKYFFAIERAIPKVRSLPLTWSYQVATLCHSWLKLPPLVNLDKSLNFVDILVNSTFGIIPACP